MSQSALESRPDEPGHVSSRLTLSRVSGRKAPARSRGLLAAFEVLH
jgi:hypothetical protein